MRPLLRYTLPGFAVGLLAGTFLQKPTPDEGAPAPAAAPSTAPVRTRTVTVTEALEGADCDALAAENRMLQKMLDDALAAEQGTALAWPDDAALPEAYTPAGFAEAVSAALAACAVDVSLVDVDCGEPPCMAMLRPGPDSEGWYAALLDECDAWKERFPKKGPQYFWDLDCPGGPQKAAAIGWSLWDVPTLTPDTYDKEQNFGKRAHTRAATIRDDFPCQPGG